MPEGTGIWLGNLTTFLHSPVFWEHGLHSASHLQTKKKIRNWETETGLLGFTLLLKGSRMRLRVLSVVSGCTGTLLSLRCKSFVDSLCTDTELPDKGHLCFVYFAEATVFAGCVHQSISSFNGLKSEKLKRGVSARSAPRGAENVQ